jgi:predicted dehydrogenase
MLRIGVVGYGTGGQHFHTPFTAAAAGCTLAAIVARAPETIAKAGAGWPDTPIYPSRSAVIAAGVCDAVTITTPPQTRRELALEAIAAGLHVIADKPFRT